ncbi:MAG: hypothetical protein ACO1PN_05890 [Betaproteobacteria bacterium]
MVNNLKEPDDSLDFTVILTNPSLATTQSWLVADAIESPAGMGDAAPATGTAKLNDHFLIGGGGAAGWRRRYPVRRSWWSMTTWSRASYWKGC